MTATDTHCARALSLPEVGWMDGGNVSKPHGTFMRSGV